jgi:sphingosine kinase
VELSTSKNEPPFLAIKFEDMAGCVIAKGKKESDTMAFLTVYAYIFVNKKKSRKRKQVELEYALHKTYNENMVFVDVWHKRIDQLIKQNILQKYAEQSQLSVEQLNKPFIVFVNPKSGSGLAKSIYQERILSVWSESNVTHKVFFTRK